MRPDTLGLLEDIRDAAQFIADDTAGMTFEAFERDRRTRQLVERNVEIIGEAVSRLRRHDPTLVARITAHNQIVGLRNALIHGYDVIDYPIVWRAVHESLPVLRAEVDRLLREATDHEPGTAGPSSPNAGPR
jgi:uncharacterized protein with HEPN domain